MVPDCIALFASSAPAMMTMADQTARRPSDSFSVRLLAVLLLIRIGASVITLGGATRVQLAGGFLFRPAVSHQLRRFFFARLLFLVERHQTYVGRALAREHRPRHEAVAQFALPLRKGGRAFPVERELVVLGVMDGLAGVRRSGPGSAGPPSLDAGQRPRIPANAGPHYAPNVWPPGWGRSRRHVPHVQLVADMFLPDA